jgi:hypothetical protein
MVLALLVTACGGPIAPPPSVSPGAAASRAPGAESTGALRLELVVEGIDRPTALADAGDKGLYVTELTGRVRVISDGRLQGEPRLDLRDRVLIGGERGLLGIALHPDFATNDRMFVSYTNLDGHTELHEFGPNGDTLLLTIPQKIKFHQAGDLSFGPDGYLYMSIGDDGRGVKQRLRPDELYGTIVRLDVDSVAGGYAIPDDNPFVAGGGLPEIWDYGFRNPWRFSFDHSTGDLWVGDVGASNNEEINLHPGGTPGGLDFGWAATAGMGCRESGCDKRGVTWPTAVYDHEDGYCGVIGGYVMRASEVLDGHYVYGDLCSGHIWSLPPDEPRKPAVQIESDLRISSFGRDAAGSIYVLVHWENGRVYRLAG